MSSPDFEDGTGRQFFVKWGNRSYVDSTFEFERDLILNEVEFKDQLASYNERRKKPTRQQMKQREKEAEKTCKKLYRVFGDKVKKRTDKEKEDMVRDYQKTLEDRVFKCGGQLRDYQAEGVSWLMSNHLNKRSSILADEMGLG